MEKSGGLSGMEGLYRLVAAVTNRAQRKDGVVYFRGKRILREFSEHYLNCSARYTAKSIRSKFSHNRLGSMSAEKIFGIKNQLRSQMTENRQSDTQAAYTQIRSRILDGRLPPGRPVSPRNIADELMLGHMPVRSAIQRLVVEGLVEVIPRKGTYVTAPTNIDLREIFEVRLALESTAAYLAAVNGATDGLTVTAEQLRRVMDDESTDLMTEQRIGWVFHQEMFSAAKNDRLYTSYRMLRAQSGLALNELRRDDATTVRRGTLEHLSIYACIQSKEPEAARRHMWNHIVDGTDARIKLIRGEHGDPA